MLGPNLLAIPQITRMYVQYRAILSTPLPRSLQNLSNRAVCVCVCVLYCVEFGGAEREL